MTQKRKAIKAAEREAKNKAKALRAYERACKLMVKVEEGSLYRLLYGSEQTDAQKLGQTIKDVLLEDDREARGLRRYDTDPRKVIETYERDHEIGN